MTFMGLRATACLLPLFLGCLVVAARPVRAEMRLGNNSVLVFATVEQGKRILTSQDAFIRHMSPFDRAARMKTDRDVSEQQFLAFVGENVLSWSDAEKNKITSAFHGVESKLDALALPFPETVYLIKTTGKEEGGAAYTRANAIVLPAPFIAVPESVIRKTICHELFHIFSRHDPDLREKLYGAIGFLECNEVPLPPDLKMRKITNPDAPRNDHCIRVTVEGKPCWVVPILFSRTRKYDTTRRGEFFNYLTFQLLLVDRDDSSSVVKPILRDGQAVLIDLRKVSGFFEQVGRNTGYIIHPEEILADNFAILVLGKQGMPSPKIVKKMKAILTANRLGKPGSRTP